MSPGIQYPPGSTIRKWEGWGTPKTVCLPQSGQRREQPLSSQTCVQNRKMEVLWSKTVTTSIPSCWKGPWSEWEEEEEEGNWKKTGGSLIVTAFITSWVPLLLVATSLTDQGRQRSTSFSQSHRVYSCKIRIISLKPNQAVGTEV